MLGKLFKYEVKCTWKIIAITNTIILILSAFATIGASLRSDNDDIYSILTTLLATFSVFLPIMGAGIFIYIFLCKRFYDTMFSAQGYLTLTLPVDKVRILNCKLLVAFMWQFVTGIVVLLCMSLYISIVGETSLVELYSTIYDNILRDHAESIIYIISGIVSSFHGLIMVFAAFSIGQLSSSHKVGMAIVSGFGISFAEGVVTGILQGITILINQQGYTATDLYGLAFLNIKLITLIIFTLSEYFICVYIIKNKTNLS